MEKVHLMMLTDKDGDIIEQRAFKKRFDCLRETAKRLKEFYSCEQYRAELFTCVDEEAYKGEHEEMWNSFCSLYMREEYADALQVWTGWYGDYAHSPIPLNYQISDQDVQ